MWEASQYCWAGSCKNHYSHPRRNIFHRHGSPLGYALVLRLLPSLIRRRGLPSHLLTFPKGTEITATVGQTLASDKNHWGDSFAASIARPVKVDGKTVLPRGAEVTGRITEAKNHELKVVLSSVVVHGIYCDLATN